MFKYRCTYTLPDGLLELKGVAQPALNFKEKRFQ